MSLNFSMPRHPITNSKSFFLFPNFFFSSISVLPLAPFAKWVLALILSYEEQFSFTRKWNIFLYEYLSTSHTLVKRPRATWKWAIGFITQGHTFSKKGAGVALCDTQSTYKVVMLPPMLHSSWMQTWPLFKNIFQKLIDGWFLHL